MLKVIYIHIIFFPSHTWTRARYQTLYHDGWTISKNQTPVGLCGRFNVPHCYNPTTHCSLLRRLEKKDTSRGHMTCQNLSFHRIHEEEQVSASCWNNWTWPMRRWTKQHDERFHMRLLCGRFNSIHALDFKIFIYSIYSPLIHITT